MIGLVCTTLANGSPTAFHVVDTLSRIDVDRGVEHPRWSVFIVRDLDGSFGLFDFSKSIYLSRGNSREAMVDRGWLLALGSPT